MAESEQGEMNIRSAVANQPNHRQHPGSGSVRELVSGQLKRKRWNLLMSSSLCTYESGHVWAYIHRDTHKYRHRPPDTHTHMHFHTYKEIKVSGWTNREQKKEWGLEVSRD